MVAQATIRVFLMNVGMCHPILIISSAKSAAFRNAVSIIMHSLIHFCKRIASAQKKVVHPFTKYVKPASIIFFKLYRALPFLPICRLLFVNITSQILKTNKFLFFALIFVFIYCAQIRRNSFVFPFASYICREVVHYSITSSKQP